MTPLLTALSVVGAVAVVLFVVFFVLGLTRGWREPVTRRALAAAFVLGGVCAVLGMLVAFL